MKKVFCKILSILVIYKVEDSNITGQGGSKMYNIEAKCVELSRKFREISEANGSTPYKLARKAEQELVKLYRSLSGEKRKQLITYVKMLQEYSGSMDG